MTNPTEPEKAFIQTPSPALFTKIALFFVLGVIAAAAHTPLRKEALNMLHADYAPIWTTAKEISRGEWSAFAFDMHYAGVVLTVFRAFALKIVSFFSASKEVGWATQGIYSFVLVPFAMALMAFWSVRKVSSFWVSYVTALVVALGARYLGGYLHNDVYTANFLLGMWVLGFRAKVSDPLKQLSNNKLLALGTLSGLMFYNSRIAVIALAVLWLPPVKEWKGFLLPFIRRNPRTRILISLAVFFFTLFLYLEIFGTNLGQFFGRRVLLNAPPNLTIGLAVLALVGVINGAWAPVWKYRKKLIWVGLGACIGFLPEIADWISFGGIPPRGSEQTRNIPEAIAVFARVPSLAAEIFAAPENGWGLFSKLLWLFGGIGMIFSARREPRYRNAVIFLAIGILVYCRIQNYAGVTPRYLLPVVPALCFGMAYGIETLFKRRWGPVLVATLIAVHATSLFNERSALAREAAASHRWEHVQEVVRIFSNEGVKVVGSDEYWFSNELSVASEMKPVFFLLEGVGLVHSSALSYWEKEPIVGFILRQRPASLDRVRFRNFDWSLREIGVVGDRILFLGKRI